MSPRKVDKKKKKHEILLAALKTFSEKGLKNARMVDIAQEAGIGKGTIYEYFSSRDDIFIQAFNYFMEEINNRLLAEIAMKKSPQKKLESAIIFLFSSLSQFSPEMLYIIIDFWSEGIRNRTAGMEGLIDLRKLYNDIRLEFKQILDEGIRTGFLRKIDTLKTASAIMAVIDGLLLQWILDPKVFDLQKIGRNTMDIFLRGIKNDR